MAVLWIDHRTACALIRLRHCCLAEGVGAVELNTQLFGNHAPTVRLEHWPVRESSDVQIYGCILGTLPSFIGNRL